MQLKYQDDPRWYESLLNEEDCALYEEIMHKYGERFWREYEAAWAILAEDVEDNLNTPPESLTGFRFAKRWSDLSDQVFKAYPELTSKLWLILRNKQIPYHVFPCSSEAVDYILKATAYYKKISKIN